jgi:hypothetical protein
MVDDADDVGLDDEQSACCDALVGDRGKDLGEGLDVDVVQNLPAVHGSGQDTL